MNTSRTYTGWLSTIAAAVGLCLLTLLPTSSALAQRGFDENAAGNTYIIAYPDTTTNTYDLRFNHQKFNDIVEVFLYSAVDSKVTITRTGGVSRSYLLTGGKFKVVDMTGPEGFPSPIVTQSGEIVDNTFKVECAQPIVVYCYMLTGFGSEAWTPIPVEAWGMEYYASSMPGEIGADLTPGGENTFVRKNKAFPSEILVIASTDNTQVSITPNGPLVDYPRTVVNLMAGQAYQVQSFVDTLLAHTGDPQYQTDLGGSHILANHPIGVISGNTRGQIVDDNAGFGKNAFKNMMIEWIAPVEQHGKEFVYMPTWDGRRPLGAPNENLNGKRTAEFVRVYATGDIETSGTVTDGVNGAQTTYRTLTQPKGLSGKFYEDKIGVFLAKRYRTDTAAEAYMFSPGIVKLNSINGSGNYIGGNYSAWSGYQVEMVPREQWVKFAPYYAPTEPAQMEHFINVVTDTASRYKIFESTGGQFIFNRGIIPGTDLVWGTKTVTPGLDNFLEGKNGAKFYAFAYGDYTGYELYRPGSAKKSGSEVQGRGKNPGVGLLHPSEYEENMALSYAYPLAPTRLVLRPPDSLKIDTVMDCKTLTITMRPLNPNPSGLRAIYFDPDTNVTQNARIVFVKPQSAIELIGRVDETIIQVVPINDLANAKARIIIIDRTGKKWYVYYSYQADRVDLLPNDVLNYGIVTLGSSKDSTVLVTNPLTRNVRIDSLYLAFPGQGFTIISPIVPPTIILAPGKSITIKIRVSPTQNKDYYDTLYVKLGCATVKVLLRALPVKPCIYVDDLNFGTLQPGESRTLDLVIKNSRGEGAITFSDPWLTWLQTVLSQQGFSVTQADIDKLKTASLSPGQSVKIKVTFTATNNLGLFQTTAHFWSSADCERDTSVWTAFVTTPGPRITGYDWKERWVVKGQSVCTKDQTTEYQSIVYVTNTGTAPFVVDTVILSGADAPFFALNVDKTNPQVVNPNDIIKPTDTGVNARAQLVYFYPKDERKYSCFVKLITMGGDTIQNILEGVGIESHVSIGGNDYGTLEYKGTPITTKGALIPVRSYKTRVLTVTDLQIVGADAGNFVIDNTVPGFTMPTAAAPWTMNPDSVINVPINFQPLSPGTKTATLRVIGDHSSCDNDSNVVTGYTYTLATSVTPWDFGDLLTCDNGDGTITFTNNGTVPITLVEVQLNDPNRVYTLLDAPPLNTTVNGGQTITIKVHYAPLIDPNARTYDATVKFVATNTAGTTDLSQTTTLTGKAHQIVVNAHINKDYHCFPGLTMDIPMTLDQAGLDPAGVDSLYIMVKFDQGMLQLQNGGDDASLLTGTILQGWSIKAKNLQPDMASFELKAPAGQFLKGSGTLMNLKFLTFLGSVTQSDITFDVTTANRFVCTKVVPDPGFIKLDAVCGMAFRLITLSANKYALDQNIPNPTGANTDIKFSVGFDGNTTLTMYNSVGEKVATLVDGYMQSGSYVVQLDTKQFPSGQYYYRLNSGTYTKTKTMILDK